MRSAGSRSPSYLRQRKDFSPGLISPLLACTDIDNGLGEGGRRFLGQIVADTAGDGPMLVFAGEFVRVCTGLQVWRAIGVAFERNGGQRDHGGLRQPLFQIVIF